MMSANRNPSIAVMSQLSKISKDKKLIKVILKSIKVFYNFWQKRRKSLPPMDRLVKKQIWVRNSSPILRSYRQKNRIDL